MSPVWRRAVIIWAMRGAQNERGERASSKKRIKALPTKAGHTNAFQPCYCESHSLLLLPNNTQTLGCSKPVQWSYKHSEVNRLWMNYMQLFINPRGPQMDRKKQRWRERGETNTCLRCICWVGAASGKKTSAWHEKKNDKNKRWKKHQACLWQDKGYDQISTGMCLWVTSTRRCVCATEGLKPLFRRFPQGIWI